MVFYEIIGWLVFWASIILAIVLYIKSKKFYPVFYLLSISLYIFTAGFMIEIFKFGRFGILAAIVVSAIIFMALGYYLSTIFRGQPIPSKSDSRR